MSTIEKAIEIAAREHAGEKDKAGQPYLFHPLRLMFAVKTPEEKKAAVLHDVVEDTKVSIKDLIAEDFSTDVIEAVKALTKDKNELRIDAAKRAASNPIAKNVKLADVRDNMDLERITNPTEGDFQRLKEYVQVRKILIDHGAT